MSGDVGGREKKGVLKGAFACANCRQGVCTQAPGTEHRNHCPYCLWSLHVDLATGDRRSGCRGLMEPVSVWVRWKGEWALLHRCRNCGMIRANRVAGDDNEFALMSLAVRPLATPPFPLDRLGKIDAAPCGIRPELERTERKES